MKTRNNFLGRPELKATHPGEIKAGLNKIKVLI